MGTVGKKNRICCRHVCAIFYLLLHSTVRTTNDYIHLHSFEDIIKMADFFYFFVVDSYFVRFFLL